MTYTTDIFYFKDMQIGSYTCESTISFPWISL